MFTSCRFTQRCQFLSLVTIFIDKYVFTEAAPVSLSLFLRLFLSFSLSVSHSPIFRLTFLYLSPHLTPYFPFFSLLPLSLHLSAFLFYVSFFLLYFSLHRIFDELGSLFLTSVSELIKRKIRIVYFQPDAKYRNLCKHSTFYPGDDLDDDSL